MTVELQKAVDEAREASLFDHKDCYEDALFLALAENELTENDNLRCYDTIKTLTKENAMWVKKLNTRIKELEEVIKVTTIADMNRIAQLEDIIKRAKALTVNPAEQNNMLSGKIFDILSEAGGKQ